MSPLYQFKPEQVDYLLKNIASNNLMGVWVSAVDWYNTIGDHRKYHNTAHAMRVIRNLFEITTNPSVELIIAALWHDAIYIPGAGSFDDPINEKASSAALIAQYKIDQIKQNKQIDLDSHSYKITKAAGELIEGTSIKNHLYNGRYVIGELPLLLDADLGSLADEWDSFFETQKNIIQENYGDPSDRKNIAKCADFLSNFLTTREFIYHTEKGRELWEDKARENIKRLIEYSSGL